MLFATSSMQDVIVIEVCLTYRNQELMKVIRLVPPLHFKAYKQPLFYVTTNGKAEMFKCYLNLYTCKITRGIILDLVKDGYTKTFINSLRTFIDRRGYPKNVTFNNGKVFAADETQAFCSNLGVSWRFSLAKAL